MEYRMLGKTGFEVSVLGFGSSPLGGVFGTIDEPEAIRAVHQAFDAGVNFVDVSPYYGVTKAETVLGKALGHSQASTTQRYAHLADNPVRQMVEGVGAKLAGLLGGPTDGKE